ncbi:MAG: tRNA 2-thiouridine synthesizing protein C [Halieaceae bacterium]|jgi:tRNA 2-thiouridine synthesizing protein C
MSNNDTSLLVICRSAPYGSSLGRDAIEFCLAASVYSASVAVLFMDDGIFQLLADQNPDDLGIKSQLRLLQSLPLYDVEQIYVDTESLTSRGVTREDLIDLAVAADQKDVEQLIQSATKVVSF